MATEAFEEIVGDFEFLEDWHDRYRYVIDLGKSMDALPECQRYPGTKVDGCASQVWILAEMREAGRSRLFQFKGDSDAMIVRGLIAVLRALFNGIPAEEIVRIDAHAELDRLGLRSHLTAQRSNGLASMVVRIRQLAAEMSCEGGRPAGPVTA